MLAVITNSYANVASAFFGAKFQKAIEEILISPMANWAILLGFIVGGIARGVLVGVVVVLVSLFFTNFGISNIFLTLFSILLTSTLFSILGLIGVLGIPLDMMTITIAAITIGIAVDNSIHYIYRFQEEYKKNNNYEESIRLCHSTVGVAILNTSITIIFGFSILVLSNFIPTIYFGVFTGIAMFLAMILVLTLLPSLILYIQPFEKRLNV